MNGNKLLYVGQKALIERDGSILILDDPHIGLDFPGGKIRENETDLKESLKREVREETGLEIEVGDVFYSWMVEFPPRPEYQINDVYLVAFKCKYVSGEVILSDEHRQFKWVNKETYKTDLFREIDEGAPHFEALRRYFEG